jgi:hypothetical protein
MQADISYETVSSRQSRGMSGPLEALGHGGEEKPPSFNPAAPLPYPRSIPMKTLVAAGFFNALVMAGFIAVTIPAHAATVPCEDMLKQMRAAKAKATLSDADMAKVNALEAKAVERCNADDDVRSDTFLAEAMTLITK